MIMLHVEPVKAKRENALIWYKMAGRIGWCASVKLSRRGVT